MAAIDVHDLRKTYDDAGETTTVEILEGYRLPTDGRVRVLGHEPARGERAFRERLGIVSRRAPATPT